MRAYQVLNDRVTERGIPVMELARRTGLDSELLRRSLKGERKLNADEFIPLCMELDINIADFAAAA